MTVAVTGASGFIGRHVLAELKRRNVAAIAVVRPGAQHPEGRVAELDVAAPPPDVFDRMERPDVLMHLAWGGLPNYRSLHHFENELPSHYRFLKTAIADGVRNVLVTGTCFEYGMQSGELSEDLDARPTNPYGFAKNALREELEHLRQTTPFNFTWARLFYLYGDGQAANSLWPQLRAAVARGDAMFNMSGGEQLRDYLPVGDVARHLVALALRRANVGVVNVCSGRPIAVRTLVERWIADNGWSIRLNLGHYPYPDYEPMAFWGSAAKLQQTLPSSEY